MKDPRIKILQVLKENGLTSSTMLQKKTRIHYYILLPILAEMENKGVIKSEKSEEKSFTYWSLKEEEVEDEHTNTTT